VLVLYYQEDSSMILGKYTQSPDFQSRSNFRNNSGEKLMTVSFGEELVV